MKQDGDINRRQFLNSVGSAALGSVFVSSCAYGGTGSVARDAAQRRAYPQVPRRKLGRTGESIPIVGQGCVFDMTKHHDVLDACLDYGLLFWDTATNYGRTKSQIGLGQYIAKHPDLRKKLFLISKPVDIETPLPVVAEFDKDIRESMDRLHTDYFDAYCGVHGLSNPDQFTDEMKVWAEKCKKRGLFKYFGYSAHSNMAEGLKAAVECGWIDLCLVAYNFQLMQDDEYQRAIDMAYKAGIGLIAIKTQRKPSIEPMPFETEADKKLAEHFRERGFTDGQAKLKLVMDDERFASAAVGMNDVDTLAQNVAAALDKTKLAQADKEVLEEYARATCDRYCTGCAHICSAAVPDVPYVDHIMRYVMYHNSYGQHRRACDMFARIPDDVRRRLLSTDYSVAEACCPQRLPIGRIVAEAVSKLA